MIERFYLKNYLSFNEAEAHFTKGLVVFTGASGTGKSIFMNALLGVFALQDAKARLSEASLNMSLDLEELGIETDDVTVFKQLKKDKVRYFVNNQSLPKKSLNKLSQSMIKHLSLKNYDDFKNSSLLAMIDSAVIQQNHSHQILLEAFEQNFEQLSTLKIALAKIEEDEKKIIELKEFARFEIDKIAAIAPKSGEDEELMQIKKQLSKKEKVTEAIGKAEGIYHAEHAVNDALELIEVESSFFDDAMNELRAHFDDALAKLNELEFLEVEEILDRIEALSDLKRRYGSIEEALLYKEKKEQELNAYEEIDSRKEKLHAEIALLEKTVQEQASELTNNRAAVLPMLLAKLNEFLKLLYLREGTLRLEPQLMQKRGVDEVIISLENTSLSTLSSGEFNRLRLALLALKTTIDKEEKGILFLDEVDANLSGEESMSIAKVLRVLSKRYQIFSISHQPQLTSQADQHFLIYREREESFIKELDEKAKIKEISRMVSGEKITKEAENFAKKILGVKA